MAWVLGMAGLLPFVIPVIFMGFMKPNVINAMESMQFAYAGLVVAFMGGVQWGYAVKQGEGATRFQYIFSIVPTLIIFGVLSFLPLFKPYQITTMFILLLIAQNIVDYQRMTEKWFLKLRWTMTAIASLSLATMGLFQYLN